MSCRWVRSATSRQERDTSGECWRCANKDKRIAELESLLKDIAYSGMHMTIGEIREKALSAIKEKGHG